jgi:hypothetical protein
MMIVLHSLVKMNHLNLNSNLNLKVKLIVIFRRRKDLRVQLIFNQYWFWRYGYSINWILLNLHNAFRRVLSYLQIIRKSFGINKNLNNKITHKIRNYWINRYRKCSIKSTRYWKWKWFNYIRCWWTSFFKLCCKIFKFVLQSWLLSFSS